MFVEILEISNNIWYKHAWVVHRQFVETKEVTNKGAWEDILVAEKNTWQ